MANSGLGDLELCLGPLFIKSKQANIVSVNVFREFVMDDLKTDISRKDLDLFLKANPAAADGTLTKSSLLEIFDEPFRIAKY